MLPSRPKRRDPPPSNSPSTPNSAQLSSSSVSAPVSEPVHSTVTGIESHTESEINGSKRPKAATVPKKRLSAQLAPPGSAATDEHTAKRASSLKETKPQQYNLRQRGSLAPKRRLVEELETQEPQQRRPRTVMQPVALVLSVTQVTPQSNKGKRQRDTSVISVQQQEPPVTIVELQRMDRILLPLLTLAAAALHYYNASIGEHIEDAERTLLGLDFNHQETTIREDRHPRRRSQLSH